MVRLRTLNPSAPSAGTLYLRSVHGCNSLDRGRSEIPRFLVTVNSLGLPSLSMPCGRSADGRPLGLQIVGRPFAEATILRLGHAYERATPWTTPPPLD